jgi:L-asparaginase/Glu-tRNA(Gln) amidotransferase subunit D
LLLEYSVDFCRNLFFVLDTFKAPEIGPLGFFTGDKPVFYRVPLRKHTVATEFDIMAINSLPRVDIVTIMPTTQVP